MSAAYILIICMALGLLYPVLASEFDDPLAFVNGAVIGLIGGVIIALHQDFTTYSRIEVRLPFLLQVILVALGYALIFSLAILGVHSVTRSAAASVDLLDYVMEGAVLEFVLNGDFKLILIWALFFSLILSFNFSISKKVAGGVLSNTVLGKYSKPKIEERVFMFVDLNSATTHAERLGEDGYFRLINDFFAHITPAVILSGGQIYRYVGDQMAVSWLVTRKFDYSWCIRAYFLARDLLFDRAEYYMTTYGFIPSFKASMHCGEVVTAEVGDIKSQIVFHGDPVYVTEQLEKECRRLGCAFIVSGELIGRVELSDFYRTNLRDKITVAEIGREVELYTVDHVKPFD